MNIKGIDVSYCQQGISWDAVKNSGCQFVLIRVGNDLKNKYDTLFDDNFKEAKKRGLAIGVYWFGEARTPEQAKTEAVWCLQKIASLADDLQLPVYYDVEIADVLNQPNISEIVEAFRSTIADAGFRAGIYCSTGWIGKINQAIINKFDSVWIADWRATCQYKGKYDIWQTGKTPKYGNVIADEDIMINNIIYNKTGIKNKILDELKNIDGSVDQIRVLLKDL